MIWIHLRRMIRSGFIGFWRNSTVSLAAILAMIITLTVVGSLMIGNVFLTAFLDTVKEKVDVTVYFTIDAAETDILALKKSLETLSEVNRVEYVTREQALLAFKERHKDDAVMLSALDEVGGNPLRASLNIKAKELSQYEGVSNFLEGDSALSPGGENIIEKVNYRQNKIVIERMNTILTYTRKVGVGIALVLAIMSIMVTVNTISLALYSSRDEISVMKLVGAANNFVRGPFMMQGAMYGVVSALLATALLYPATFWLGKSTETAFGGLNIFRYYIADFGQLFLTLLGVGILLGMISSLFALSRYLKV